MLEERHNLVKIAQLNSVGYMLDFLDKAAIGCLLATVMVPPLSNVLTFIASPALFIIMSSIYINLIDSIDNAERDLKFFTTALDIPAEFTECFEDVQLDFVKLRQT